MLRLTTLTAVALITMLIGPAAAMAQSLTSQDYIAFLASQQTMLTATKGKRVDFKSLTKAMTSTKLINVNYGQPDTGGGAVDDFLTYRPLNGTTQRNGRAYGIVVPR